MSVRVMVQHLGTQSNALCAAINVLSEYLLTEGISEQCLVALQTVCMEAGAHVPLSEVRMVDGWAYLDKEVADA